MHNQIAVMDALDLCHAQPKQSIDMILTDPPYGTTSCAWDSLIPFEAMWEAFHHAIKPGGAIVITASQPFTTALIFSNLQNYKYSWVWIKSQVSNPANAQRQPLRITEDVCVFNAQRYYPQDLQPFNQMVNKGTKAGGEVYRGGLDSGEDYLQEYTNYPRNVLFYPRPAKPLHPTQKPVDLFAYLIKTYTQPGQIVLDPFCGSGTTALAAKLNNRKYICGDENTDYVHLARQRVNPTFGEMPTRPRPQHSLHDLPLFEKQDD